jgi:hypothetical protein
MCTCKKIFNETLLVGRAFQYSLNAKNSLESSSNLFKTCSGEEESEKVTKCQCRSISHLEPGVGGHCKPHSQRLGYLQEDEDGKERRKSEGVGPFHLVLKPQVKPEVGKEEALGRMTEKF